MEYDVFISYSTHDKPIADAVCATLENHGIRCWIAPRDIMAGNDWSDAIIDAITACRVFVLVLSVASNQSEQVKREVQNAVSEGKPILPFRIEDVALSKHMRYFIGTPHWLDALTPPMERHLLRMVQTVSTLMTSLDDKSMLLPDALLPPPTEQAPVKSIFLWNEELLTQIETELCTQIGPFGQVLVQQASETASGYSDLCQRLAEQIFSAPERQAFISKCITLIGGDSPTPADPVPAPVILSQDTLALGEKALAEYMGPLARVLAKRAARDATSREDFYQRLSAHLSTPQEVAAFLKKVSA